MSLIPMFSSIACLTGMYLGSKRVLGPIRESSTSDSRAMNTIRNNGKMTNSDIDLIVLAPILSITSALLLYSVIKNGNVPRTTPLVSFLVGYSAFYSCTSLLTYYIDTH